jgi:hypothetical protein
LTVPSEYRWQATVPIASVCPSMLTLTAGLSCRIRAAYERKPSPELAMESGSQTEGYRRRAR